MNHIRSISDLASKEDWLGMTNHYKGITKFIERCDTPMTIAIQGDWGIGKTSAMENIQERLRAEMLNPCIWFKTWQFSALNNSNTIFIEFMLTFLDKLDELIREIRIAKLLGGMPKNSFKQQAIDELSEIIMRTPWDTEKLLKAVSDIQAKGSSKKIREDAGDINKLIELFKSKYCVPVSENSAIIDDQRNSFSSHAEYIMLSKQNLLKLGVNISAAALNAFSGFLPGYAAIPINGGIDCLKDKAHNVIDEWSEQGKDGIQASQNMSKSSTLFLVSICNEINYIIEDILKYFNECNDNISNDNRLCIFVDDLDRLQPQVALELLEGLKNFVEYGHCVFVLAIDKAVIDQGLRSKYDEKFLLGKDEKTSKRTRADKYFDKIIQVPFEIQDKSYNIESYMQHLLEKKGLAKQGNGDSNVPTAADYAEVLKKLKLYNPRGIKRCFNLQALYDSMGEANPALESDAIVQEHREWYDLCSFAVTIIRVENPEMYREIMKHVPDSAFQFDNVDESDIVCVWDEVEKLGEKLEYSDINAVFSCFQKAEEHTKAYIKPWLLRILFLSNYDNTFNKNRVYIEKLRKIVALLAEDNSSRLDFSEYVERLDSAIESNAEDFGRVSRIKNDEGMAFAMGWPSGNPRPYITIDSKNVIGLQLEQFSSFVKYKRGDMASMEDGKIYYICDEVDPQHIALYISSEPEISDELKQLFVQLGLLSKHKG